MFHPLIADHDQWNVAAGRWPLGSTGGVLPVGQGGAAHQACAARGGCRLFTSPHPGRRILTGNLQIESPWPHCGLLTGSTTRGSLPPASAWLAHTKVPVTAKQHTTLDRLPTGTPTQLTVGPVATGEWTGSGVRGVKRPPCQSCHGQQQTTEPCPPHPFIPPGRYT